MSYGGYNTYSATYQINPGIPSSLGDDHHGYVRRISLGILERLSVAGEGHQMDGFKGSIGAALFARFDSEYSYEDLATNWVGLVMKADELAGKGTKTELMKKHCGTVLSKKDARCLFDNMTFAQKASHQNKTAPVLFGSNYRKRCYPCISAKPSDIFGKLLSEAQSAARVWSTLTKETVKRTKK